MTLKEHMEISRRALGQCFRLDKRYIACLFLNAFLTAIVGYIPLYFSAKVIDALYMHASVKTIGIYVVLTVGLVFLVQLANNYIESVKNVSCEAWYRSEAWMYSEKAMQMAYESIEDAEVTRLLYRVRMESQTGFNRYYFFASIEGYTGNITKIAASLAMSFSFFILPSVPAFYKLAMVLALALTLYISVRTAAKINRINQDFWEKSVGVNVLSSAFYDYIENYSAGKEIRLYGMEDFLADACLEMDKNYNEMGIQKSYQQALWALPGTVMESIFQFGIYAVLIFAALGGGISVGSIAKYAGCIMLLVHSVIDMAGTVQMSFDNHHYLKRYFSYFDIPNHMYQGSLTVEKREDNEYFVEFRDVSFRYPNTKDYALRHVSLKFKIGEKLAVVGKNGSGKTTFIKLLCRLYDPTEGEILLNGVNIKKYDYNEYVSIFSMVFQDFKLFSFRLGEVVASNRQFDPERVSKCLEMANFKERFTRFPEGANTCLYKNFDKSGIEISGGEAQKIALARALYKDAPFMVLDEPTAALDPVSEYEVYSNFNQISGDKTSIYISHRLASCRFCDKIAVFDEGRLVQAGTHQELLSCREGRYYELWHAQAKYYTGKDGDKAAFGQG